MESLLKALGAILVFAALIFLAPLIGIACGAFGGWVVGHFYPDTLSLISAKLFGEPIPAWQLGAALGFVGGFFKASQTNKSGD